MKRKRELKGVIVNKKISEGNLIDLIGPFLCQIKLIRSIEDINSLTIYKTVEGHNIMLRMKGGVENSKELCKGDKI